MPPILTVFLLLMKNMMLGGTGRKKKLKHPQTHKLGQPLLKAGPFRFQFFLMTVEPVSVFCGLTRARNADVAKCAALLGPFHTPIMPRRPHSRRHLAG